MPCGQASTTAMDDGSHIYTYGGICGEQLDTSGQPLRRSTRIIFHCAAEFRGASIEEVLKAHNRPPRGFLASVEERDTCNYEAVFITALACQGRPVAEATASSTFSMASLLQQNHAKCVHRTEGWWHYEFCYGLHIRQYHSEGDRVVNEFFLGRGMQLNGKAQAAPDEATSAGTISQDKEGRKYLSMRYINGSSCDLSHKPREAELRLVCVQGLVSTILQIEEVSTCKYMVVVGVPELCKHPEFKVKKQVVRHISCLPV